MHTLPRFFRLVASASITLIAISNSLGQSLGPPAAAPALGASGSPTAAVTFSDGSSLAVRSKSGSFPLIAASAVQSMNIQVRFAPNATSTGLIVQPLDGGTASQSSASVAADGTASAQFQPGSQPGLYRVLLNQGGTTSLLQFWVADPQNPNSGPPALQP